MCARAHADDGSPRLAALEEDHRGDREDVVARRDARLLVDVQSRDRDGKLLEDRLERLARAAPRRPEVDEQRPARDRVVEIPILFADRTAGQSKMSRAIVLEAVWKVPALRLAALMGRL